jgi:hypothetical protein
VAARLAVTFVVALAGFSHGGCIIDTVPLPEGTDGAFNEGTGGGSAGSPPADGLGGDADDGSPEITQVQGNGGGIDPVGNPYLGDGLFIEGLNLLGADIILVATDSRSWALEVRAATDVAIEVVLPTDITADLFTLLATNDFGVESVPLQLMAGVPGSNEDCP